MSDEGAGPSTPKKTLKKRNELPASEKGKHRAQKYRCDWEKLHLFKGWLQPGKNEFKAKCTVCDVELLSEIHVLRTHASRQKHIKALGLAQSTSKERSLMTNFVTKNTPKNKVVMATEIKIAGFLAEHNLAFVASDHLSDLINSILEDFGVDHKIAMKKTKATAVVTEVIGASEKLRLIDLLKSHKFSVLTDESTDISTNKSSCVIVRYFDTEKNKVVSQLWELCKIFDTDNPDTVNEGATGKNLYEILMKSFTGHNIPTDNIVGFAADGCNVMMGGSNSVASRLREQCPGIFIMKCVCHSAHLCASEACKQLPRRCEDLARDIYSFFKNSSKRQCRLQEFQEFLNIKPHKILHPSQTRWLSLNAVVERLLEQWNALKLFFTDCWLHERLVSTELTFNSLNDPFIKMYFMFLSWVLPKFTGFNKLFQSENVVILSLNEKIREVYKDILLCFLKRDYVNRTDLAAVDVDCKEQWLNDSELYLGIKVMNNITSPEIMRRPDLRQDFYKRCREFMIVSAKEIQKRYDLNDPILSKLECLQPTNAVSNSYRNKIPSLQPLMILVPRIVGDENEMQKIDNEWRNLPNIINKNINLTTSPDKFWGDVNRDFEEFKSISQFSLNLLILPHSSADCERIFSQVNLIKTKIRNCLSNESINGTLLAKQHILNEAGSCANFKPNNEMMAKMTSNVLYKKQM